MKSNDSLFRKAYNNHHDKNGSDVSSTADDFMRSDIGDGVFLDGENFSNANGDDKPNYYDPIPLGGESGGNPNGNGLNINLNDFSALFGDNCMLMMQQITGQNNPVLVPGYPYYQGMEFSGKSNANGDGMNQYYDFLVDVIIQGLGGCQPNITNQEISYFIFQSTQNQNNANDPELISLIRQRYFELCDTQPTQDLSEFLFVECNTPYGDGSYCGEDYPGYTRYAEFNIMSFLDNLGLFFNYPPFVDCMNQEIGGQENSNLKVGNQLAFRFRLIAQSIYKISDYTNMTELFQTVANIKAKVGAEARSQANYPMTNGVSPGSQFSLPLQTGESAGQPDCYAYPLHCLHNVIAETEQTLYNFISGEGTSTGTSDGGEGTVVGNLFDAILGANPPNPYGSSNQSFPSWITPNAPGLPDIQSCSGITPQLYQMYSPYLTAYTPYNFNVDGGSIGNILNQLEGQNIGFYTQEAMQSYDNYVALVTAGLLCAAGMDENSSPDLDSFWNNLPENCQLQSYTQGGGTATTEPPSYTEDGGGEVGIYEGVPPSSTDDGGGMVAPNDEPQVSYLDEIPNSSKNFSNANGSNNNALIQ